MLDANDSYTAFGIDNSTTIDLLGTQVRFAWFFVASNTAFDIYADASNLVTSGDITELEIIILATNSLNVRPHRHPLDSDHNWLQLAGTGLSLEIMPMVLHWMIFQPGKPKSMMAAVERPVCLALSRSKRRALRVFFRLRGSPITGANYDFSMGTGILSADVTYTVFAP